MTLIVVEGIDGSGKSTLIADLAHQIPDEVHIIRRGPIRNHPMEEYEYPLTAYSPGYYAHYLLDRWHIGELIYGPLYRGVSQLTPAQRIHIDMVLDKLGAIKVLMSPPLDVVRQRIQQRGETFLQPQHQQLVYDAYAENCNASTGWITLTSPTKLPLDSLIKSAEDAEIEAQDIDQFQTYVGPFRPTALLLGDVRGPEVHGRPRYPWAFVPYRDTSGHFLLTALDAVGFNGFGLANANEETVPELWETLGQPPICLLGKEALDGCKRKYAGQQFWDRVTKVVEHPQYVRRFKNGKMREYGALIKETVSG